MDFLKSLQRIGSSKAIMVIHMREGGTARTQRVLEKIRMRQMIPFLEP